MADLVSAWLRTARGIGARADVAGAGAHLLARWSEPHRRYHDVRHLGEVLDRVDELADVAVDAGSVRAAAWFHDAVYDLQASDNEQRSAELVPVVLNPLRVDPRVVAEVARLVLVTATHQVGEDDRNAAVLCDADLAVLAAPAEAYDSYAARVREEYAHVPDHDFAAGRSAVLAALLDRPWLYATAAGRDRWEDAARRNVGAELERLAGPPT